MRKIVQEKDCYRQRGTGRKYDYRKDTMWNKKLVFRSLVHRIAEQVEKRFPESEGWRFTSVDPYSEFIHGKNEFRILASCVDVNIEAAVDTTIFRTRKGKIKINFDRYFPKTLSQEERFEEWFRSSWKWLDHEIRRKNKKGQLYLELDTDMLPRRNSWRSLCSWLDKKGILAYVSGDTITLDLERSRGKIEDEGNVERAADQNFLTV